MSTVGQPLGQLGPLRAAVGRLVERALGTAADELPDGAPALIGRGIEHVGILRIHHHVGDAGVGADGQDGLPGLAAVGRLVEAAVAAGVPQRADRAHVDDVRVARIDEDVLDVLGVLEPHPRPRLAGVGRLVDAVAVADAALVVVLARRRARRRSSSSDRRRRRRANTSRRSRRSASRCCRGSRSSTGCRR